MSSFKETVRLLLRLTDNHAFLDARMPWYQVPGQVMLHGSSTCFGHETIGGSAVKSMTVRKALNYKVCSCSVRLLLRLSPDALTFTELRSTLHDLPSERALRENDDVEHAGYLAGQIAAADRWLTSARNGMSYSREYAPGFTLVEKRIKRAQRISDETINSLKTEALTAVAIHRLGADYRMFTPNIDVSEQCHLPGINYLWDAWAAKAPTSLGEARKAAEDWTDPVRLRRRHGDGDDAEKAAVMAYAARWETGLTDMQLDSDPTLVAGWLENITYMSDAGMTLLAGFSVVTTGCKWLLEVPRYAAEYLNESASASSDTFEIAAVTLKREAQLTALTLWDPREYKSPYRRFDDAAKAAAAIG